MGTLRVAARVDSTNGRVGNPILLTVTVAGRGNVSLFPRPTIAIPWASAVPTVERVTLSSDSLDIRGASPAAMRLLMDYAWPGNVRELENVLERGMVLAEGTQVEPEHLPQGIQSPAAAALPEAQDLSVKRQAQALEKALIQRALAQTGGNRTRAAKLLDLSHRALLYKIREYGLGD